MSDLPPKISVIIPTFRDWDALKLCLNCLLKQDIDAESFEIIVANNHISADLPDDLNLPKNGRVIWEPKPGSYAARNAALRCAKGEIIFFTDSDCLPNSDWLSVGIKAFEMDKDVARLSGAIELFPATETWNAFSLYDNLFCLQQAEFARSGRAATANIAVRRTVFETVGTFRETAFSGGDMDWAARAQSAGFPLQYDPSMIVRHPARDHFSPHVRKTARKAGARYVEKAMTKPFLRRIPRFENVFPSFRALRTVLSAREYPLRLRIAAWGVHYCLGWVDMIEYIRLGFFNKDAERA